MVLVQLVDIELALFDQVEIGYHDASQRSHEAGIPRQEGKEASCVFYDVPRCAHDAENGNNDGCAEYVDVLGIEP